MNRLARIGLGLLPCIDLMAAGQAYAQQAESSAPPASTASAATDVPTLDKVQALRPDEEVLDLYTFDNPIAVDPTRFSKDYSTGITPEQMALDPRYGGYVNHGINQGLLQTWKGIKHIAHMRPYEQPAIARPPPLSEEQMGRAAEATDVVESPSGKRT